MAICIVQAEMLRLSVVFTAAAYENSVRLVHEIPFPGNTVLRHNTFLTLLCQSACTVRTLFEGLVDSFPPCLLVVPSGAVLFTFFLRFYEYFTC
jgi:hypothetical protein